MNRIYKPFYFGSIVDPSAFEAFVYCTISMHLQCNYNVSAMYSYIIQNCTIMCSIGNYTHTRAYAL